jgi:uroporphyrinogen-III decarboxylase
MTNKQRVHAALEGRPVDRCPVTALYNQLYQDDHFHELTGLPAWQLHAWQAMPPEQHVALFRVMQEAAPFELLQPHGAPGRAWRARQVFVEEDGHAFRCDRVTGERVQLDVPTASGHASDYHANEIRRIFTREDIDHELPLPGPEASREGMDYVDAVVQAFGRDEFILSGGVIGTIYSCGWHVGQTNLFSMLIEEPALVEALCERITACNLAEIRRLAAAGGDAIYIDDATATSDMISPAMYQRFSLPYLQAMVAEIHRLGHKAIVIYFGGVMDRLELIAASGADGFSYETSMKGYINDTAEIARRIGDRMTLFSNIDPLAVLEQGTEDELAAEITRQVEAAHTARGFILTPASPITPATPLARVRRFLELGQMLSCR